MTGVTKTATAWTVWMTATGAAAAILAWISVRAMQSEREQQQITIRAENERLALWRMESRLLPLISRESALNGSAGVFGPGSIHSPESLIAYQASAGQPRPINPEFVSCRFHIDRNGDILHLGPTGWRRRRNGSLDELNPEQQAFHNAMAEADAARLFADFDRLRGSDERSTVPLPIEPSGEPTDPPPQSDDQQMLLTQRSRNQVEFNRRAFSSNATGLQSITALNNYGNTPTIVWSPADSPLLSYWQNGQLLLARSVELASDGGRAIHGCVLDWEQIRRSLCDDVRELLPNATLIALENDAVADNYSLATIPARLVPGDVPPVEIPFWSPMRVSLLVAWIGFGICAAAIGALIVGLMRLSRRRADFVSAVSHELRTPLTTFRIYTDLLSDSESTDDEKRQRYLDTLKRESTRLTSLVDNVLGFSRLETTSRSGPLEMLDWSTFMESIGASLTERTDQSGMTIRCDTDEPPGTRFSANASALERILFNLVDNACKYAAEGESREIAIVARSADATFEIRVSDHGPGLSADARKRLFKPFSKSATEAARTAHGVGLGLSLSRQLARSMRGDLILEKSSPAGTTFLVRLPG